MDSSVRVPIDPTAPWDTFGVSHDCERPSYGTDVATRHSGQHLPPVISTEKVSMLWFMELPIPPINSDISHWMRRELLHVR
jgi:hypothetical protein